MERRLAVLALGLVLAFGLGACGGDDDEGGVGTTTTEETTTDTTTDETTTTDEDTEAEGRTVFVSSCGSCHTLSDAGTTGTIGPNLDGAGVSQDEVETQVREGGGGMPAFQDVLTEEQIESVSEYVADAAQG